jgi:Protein of unknown function, DUF255
MAEQNSGNGPQSGSFNALASEPSAYLRQHAHNPVYWQPFGDEAFALAATRDVPVFLSIGYAACHWCHVMAHESFEDQATADYLNAHFVSIKVDREERPDVDSTYMAATQAISGQGGWPMSVFLTPEGLAFHAGTYFPPSPLPGRPSFLQVLEAVREAWLERRDAVEQNARTLAAGMADAQAGAAVVLDAVPEALDAALPAAAVRELARSEDPDDGGFGRAPKFPPSAVLEFLIRHAAVPSETSDPARDMAGRTLAVMARSALRDQLDGGFARYSVTADWSLPHFEKMLYDNAQLVRVYAHWVRLGGDAVFPAEEAAAVAADAAAWMVDALGLGGDAVGGLASSLDADTVVHGVHHEGATYLWTPAQLRDVLGPDDGPAIARLMNMGEPGLVRPCIQAAVPTQRKRCSGNSPARRCWPNGPGVRNLSGMTKWWRAGTAWLSPRWPKPVPSWTNRTSSRPPKTLPPTCSACTGLPIRRPAVRAFSAFPTRAPPGESAVCWRTTLSVPTACWRFMPSRGAAAGTSSPSSSWRKPPPASWWTAGWPIRRGSRSSFSAHRAGNPRWIPSTTRHPAERPHSPAPCWHPRRIRAPTSSG